jgi:putative colanic acid biosynthesis acetyltransferase WcaF
MSSQNNGLDLAAFDNRTYQPGRPLMAQIAWFVFGLPLLRCSVIPSSGLRLRLLRLFGAKIGNGVVIKPGVRVKYPWRLTVGDHTWLGEDCWIDNVADVRIGAQCCVSQGAYLCTGNHDWSDPLFRLVLGPIVLEDGAWVGARAMVCPGVRMGKLSILTAGGVAVRDLPEREIHAGNPASFLRTRPLTFVRTDEPE